MPTDMEQLSKEEKYWIKPGIHVRLKFGGPIMEVMRLLQVAKRDEETGKWVVKMQGVKCKYTVNGELRTEIHHTRDLVRA